MRVRKPRVRKTPEERAVLRRKRALLRKEKAKVQTGTRDAIPEKDDVQEIQFWAGLRSRTRAMKVINDHKERPYWLSIVKESGNPPLCGYYPVDMFSHEGRWYFGFLFREHRDRVFIQWRKSMKAKKHFTDGLNKPVL